MKSKRKVCKTYYVAEWYEVNAQNDNDAVNKVCDGKGKLIERIEDEIEFEDVTNLE